MSLNVWIQIKRNKELKKKKERKKIGKKERRKERKKERERKIIYWSLQNDSELGYFI